MLEEWLGAMWIGGPPSYLIVTLSAPHTKGFFFFHQLNCTAIHNDPTPG